MNEKQIQQLAYARARRKLKRSFTLPMLTLSAVLFFASFITGNYIPLFASLVVTAIVLVVTARMADKIKAKIIQNKDSQMITEKDVKGVAADRATSGKEFWLWNIIVSSLVVIPVVVHTIPIYYRCILLAFGLIGIGFLLIKSKHKRNAIKKGIDKEFRG